MTDNNEYHTYLLRFANKFEKGIKQVDLDTESKTGYIFLFIRDLQPGCIDLVTNLTTKCVLDALEMALSNSSEQIDDALTETPESTVIDENEKDD